MNFLRPIRSSSRIRNISISAEPFPERPYRKIRKAQSSIRFRFFAWAKELKGIDAWKEFGLNLLDVGDALRKVGALAMEYAPYKMGDHERDFLADPANYPAELKNACCRSSKGQLLRCRWPA